MEKNIGTAFLSFWYRARILFLQPQEFTCYGRCGAEFRALWRRPTARHSQRDGETDACNLGTGWRLCHCFTVNAELCLIFLVLHMSRQPKKKRSTCHLLIRSFPGWNLRFLRLVGSTYARVHAWKKAGQLCHKDIQFLKWEYVNLLVQRCTQICNQCASLHDLFQYLGAIVLVIWRNQHGNLESPKVLKFFLFAPSIDKESVQIPQLTGNDSWEWGSCVRKPWRWHVTDVGESVHFIPSGTVRSKGEGIPFTQAMYWTNLQVKQVFSHYINGPFSYISANTPL